MANYCKNCGKKVYTSSHYCPKTNTILDRVTDDSFIISAAIGAATGSSLLGGLLGGDLLGAIAGDMLDGDLWD
jgi:hypothetical protein